MTEGPPIGILYLVCDRCGSLQKSHTPFVVQAQYVCVKGGKENCRRCGHLIAMPDGVFKDGQFMSLMTAIRDSVTKTPNPIETAEKNLSSLRGTPLTNPIEIEEAINSPELQWLKEYLPDAKELWASQVRKIITILLTILLSFSVVKCEQGTAFLDSQPIEYFYNAMNGCEEMSIIILADAVKSADPEKYLVELRSKIASTKTVQELRNVSESSLPWLKAIIPSDPQQFGGEVREVILFGLYAAIATAISKCTKKKNKCD